MLAGEGVRLADVHQFLALQRIDVGRLTHAGVPEIVSRPKPTRLRALGAKALLRQVQCNLPTYQCIGRQHA